MKKILIAVLSLGFLAATSGLVLADGTATPVPVKKAHPKHHKMKKHTVKKEAPVSAPASTTAPEKK